MRVEGICSGGRDGFRKLKTSLFWVLTSAVFPALHFPLLGVSALPNRHLFVAWRLHHSADSISSVCLGVQTLGPFSLEKSFKIPMRRHSWCCLPSWSVSTCILWTVCFLDFSFSVAWWSLSTEALAHGKWLFQCVALSGSLLFSHTGSFYKDFILYQPIKNKLGLK